MYPSAELEKYASLIKDYCSIPESSRLYVLKCYYDGIFNGDENGCFNPGDPLKRCEAAKLIAAIIYRNLRASADLRENSTKFSEDDYTYDSNGVKQLKPEALEKLLDACRNFFTIESGTKNELVINAKSTLPEGYTCEILVSRYLYGRNYRAYHFGLSIKDSASDDTAANKRVLLAYQGVPCEATVLIMLRNQLDSGEIEAVSEYRIGKDLSVKLLSRQTRSAV
ncbi:hypothetical protein SDC9_118043 [bioreactor metagenome]|uniref:SLH domain-containing protein n=1 Tax=bioreactor metagenome TaxID=1076179 RepID=A0A645BZY3_9ZZZZ